MSIRIGTAAGLGGSPFQARDGMKSFRAWVDLCEASSIDSIWQSDRVISRDFAIEPIVLLSVLAGATQRLKFGTNAVVLPFRDPLTFARQCAALDQLSDGRFFPTVGIGGGASPEWAATGRSPKGRGARADEALEVMTRLWAEESANFSGEHYQLKGASIAPRPRQNPFPLWLGGASAAAVRRTARFGHGWLAPLQSPSEAGETVRAIQAECERIQRPIPSDHYGATILYRIESKAEAAAGAAEISSRAAGRPEYKAMLEKVQAVGDAETVLARIRAYAAEGVTKFIAIPIAKSFDDLMEQTRRLDQEVLPFANSDANSDANPDAIADAAAG